MLSDQLLTFAVVADTGNISRAAQTLHLTQPAVSGQLKLLQESFGEPLYRRQGHGIALTPAGAYLAGYARRLQQVYREAQTARCAWRGLTAGLLRLGASTTPASYLLPARVADFRRRHPGVEVRIVDGNTGDIVAMLGRLDLAFIEGAVPAALPPDTAVHAWGTDEVVAIVPAGHRLATRGAGLKSEALKPVSLAALAGEPLVMREPGSGVRHLVEAAFRQAGLSAAASLELAGVEGIKQAVRAGLGVGFVSALSMRHEDGALCALPIGRDGLRRTLSILVPHAQTSARAARQFLADCLQDGAEATGLQSPGLPTR